MAMGGNGPVYVDTRNGEEKVVDVLVNKRLRLKERIEVLDAEWEEAVERGHSDGKIVSLSKDIIRERKFLDWLTSTLINNGFSDRL